MLIPIDLDNLLNNLGVKTGFAQCQTKPSHGNTNEEWSGVGIMHWIGDGS